MKNSDRISNTHNIRPLILCGLFCALITLGAYIRIPFPVPVTMQLLFSNTAALLLGKRYGCICSLLYVCLGLAGLPVFASGGGITSLLSPSFGFTVGFIPGAFLAGLISERSKSNTALFAACAVDTAAVYLCGTAYYLAVCRLYLAQAYSLSYALTVCVVPFLIPDCIKCAASILIYKRLRVHL